MISDGSRRLACSSAPALGCVIATRALFFHAPRLRRLESALLLRHAFLLSALAVFFRTLAREHGALLRGARCGFCRGCRTLLLSNAGDLLLLGACAGCVLRALPSFFLALPCEHGLLRGTRARVLLALALPDLTLLGAALLPGANFSAHPREQRLHAVVPERALPAVTCFGAVVALFVRNDGSTEGEDWLFFQLSSLLRHAAFECRQIHLRRLWRLRRLGTRRRTCGRFRFGCGNQLSRARQRRFRRHAFEVELDVTRADKQMVRPDGLHLKSAIGQKLGDARSTLWRTADDAGQRHGILRACARTQAANKTSSAGRLRA
jgi:hypothetical protein